MNITNLYEDNEDITLQSYLNKYGITDIKEYLNPTGKYIESPYLYKNMIEAVNEIKYWKLQDSVKIDIVEDSDTDGIMSSLIVYDYLFNLLENSDIRILLHEGKERGLDDNKVFKEIINRKPDLVIVPDAGTNNRQFAEKLLKNGISLIVLDHHDIDKDKINKTGILVNNQFENQEVQKCGSGALVTHKFLQALDNEFNLDWSQKYIDLVALSLISDSMNMCSMENRTYYYYGLEKIKNVNNEFLKQLIIKFIGDKEYTQRDLSFKIVPKINSVIRSDNKENKQRLFMAFLGADNFEEVCNICEESHKEQIRICEEQVNVNKDKYNVDDNVVFLISDTLPKSYSGLIAGKIMSKVGNKPAIVGKIKNGIMVGSIRSPIDIEQQLHESNLIEWVQGHGAIAAGISIKDCNIEPLKEYFNNITLNYDTNELVLRTYKIKDIPNKLFDMFSDFGSLWSSKGVPSPLFALRSIVFNSSDINVLGGNKRTLKVHIDGVDILIFNVSKEDKEKFGLGHIDNDEFIEDNKKIKLRMDCIGSLGLNIWRGKKTNQIIVDKYEIQDYNRAKEELF